MRERRAAASHGGLASHDGRTASGARLVIHARGADVSYNGRRRWALGTILGIWVKRSHGGVMDRVDTAELVEGRGLEGDATQGGRRQVTILSLDRWRERTALLPGPPDPAVRRANLLVEGVDLDDSRGRTLRVGHASVRIFGETRPCHQMDEACPGLRDALDPAWSGGAFGEVMASGAIGVGDNVEWEPTED